MSSAAHEVSRLEIVPATEMPRDPVFERWAADGLVWLPERGMGRLPLMGVPYDEGYFENYVRLAATDMGRKITAARVDLVRRFTDRHVVDIGIGCGAFIEARQGWTWGYDVNPVAIDWLKRHARWCDPYEKPVESVSLWDVLEHIPEPSALLDNVRRFVFISVPIVPGAGPPPADWRHYKPGEHIWYWAHEGLVAWIAEHGFELREASKMETSLGRQDIGTFVFQREREARP